MPFHWVIDCRCTMLLLILSSAVLPSMCFCLKFLSITYFFLGILLCLNQFVGNFHGLCLSGERKLPNIQAVLLMKEFLEVCVNILVSYSGESKKAPPFRLLPQYSNKNCSQLPLSTARKENSKGKGHRTSYWRISSCVK